MSTRDAGDAPNALTVSALTIQLRDHVEARFRGFWVVGELSNLKVHSSGHVYLTLKDPEARLDAVVWRTTAASLKWRPGEGTLVLAFGRLSVYPPRGGYQMVIERLEPVGAGALDAALQALKTRLEAEGLFDAARKRALPRLPRAVGVVTSATGAARRDIEAVIQRRSPQIPIVLYPAQVQGEGAAADVVRGVERLGAMKGVDVIIVGRGGGSAEDLAAFNTEAVARAIAACPVPVISAVGHETDTTIADQVADLRAPTPSAAAEAAVPVRDDLRLSVDACLERLDRAAARAHERRMERVQSLTARLSRGLSFEGRRRLLVQLHTALTDQTRRSLRRTRARVLAAEQTLGAQHPHARLSRAREALNRARARLEQLGPQPAATARRELAVLAARLAALSPLASLDRGYSLTRTDDGRLVRAHDEVEVGETLQTWLRSGWVSSTVTARGPESPLPNPESRR